VGGLREAVLERDGYHCRGCGAPGREKRSITVHHRVPGVYTLDLMDLALSRLSRQGGAHEDGSLGDEPATPRAVAGATPGWPGTNHAGLQHARACGNHYLNAVQVLSGLNPAIVFATSAVSFPRSFSKTTWSWLMMNVLIPVSPYFAGYAT
jgi:hypothetical protein